MRRKSFGWFGRKFTSFSAEAQSRGSAAEQAEELFRRAEAGLREFGSSLDHAVRVRVWGRDRHARDAATAVRAHILTGRRRAASSSYVSAARFDSDAQVAIDLLALASPAAGAVRAAVEFEPARAYIRSLNYENFVFVSGFTSELDTLEDQARQVFSDVADTLERAATGRDRIVKAAVFLDRRHDIEPSRSMLASAGALEADLFEIEWVDGFARDKGLLEVEVTAVAGNGS
jgi:enamine deaminase RidA (YjgF/YER057c/UK114 family)